MHSAARADEGEDSLRQVCLTGFSVLQQQVTILEEFQEHFRETANAREQGAEIKVALAKIADLERRVSEAHSAAQFAEVRANSLNARVAEEYLSVEMILCSFTRSTNSPALTAQVASASRKYLKGIFRVPDGGRMPRSQIVRVEPSLLKRRLRLLVYLP